METPSDALHDDHELHALMAEHAAPAPAEVAAAATSTDASGEEDRPQVQEAEADDRPSRAFGDLHLIEASSIGLSVSDLEHSSDQFLASNLNASHTEPTGELNASAIDVAKLQPEVMQWLEQCRVANASDIPSEDDVLYYLDNKYPEMLRSEARNAVFEWVSRCVASVETSTGPRFSTEVRDVALQTLNASPDSSSALVIELGLKSATTLQYWQFLRDRISTNGELQTTKRRTAFMHEKELLEWLLSHKHSPITNHDIVNHLQSHYPTFFNGRSSASVGVWVARFLKRHLPSESNSLSAGLNDHDIDNGSDDRAASTSQGHTLGDDSSSNARKRRAKRKSPNGYVLHSNEFKLNALKKLDEGKTISEVAEELGIKCPNTLVYWNSIRDKLAVADKKRFRLAGGGRRSTCTFEDELMAWVSDRHHKGLGTDVKAVLDYMREYHSSFTDGKKEPTLRKWILRFFKRWRQPSVVTGAAADDDELDKTNGILV